MAANAVLHQARRVAGRNVEPAPAVPLARTGLLTGPKNGYDRGLKLSSNQQAGHAITHVFSDATTVLVPRATRHGEP